MGLRDGIKFRSPRLNISSFIMVFNPIYSSSPTLHVPLYTMSYIGGLGADTVMILQCGLNIANYYDVSQNEHPSLQRQYTRTYTTFI